MFEIIIQAAQQLISGVNLLAMALGSLLGLIVGILPGMGGAMGVALLTPAIYGMAPEPALMMLIGVFGASRFGGAIGGILFNVPGTASSAATALDGYPMMRQGQAAQAIALAAVASWIGGNIGAFALLLFSPVIAAFALSFGPAEYFLLSIFGLTIIAALSKGSLVKGLIAGFLGVFLGTIGADPIRGTIRFAFQRIYLFDGIELIWALIGLFGCAQAIELIGEKKSLAGGYRITKWKLNLLVKQILSNWITVIRSSLIGVIIGAIPGTGGAVASWISYNEAKRFSKHPEKFGTGIPEGVIASEATDNACEGGSLIPTFALGIPGGGIAAVLLGSLMIVGIQPGPRMFTENAVTTYSVILSIFVSNTMFLLIGLFMLQWMAKIAEIPGRMLVAPIIVLAVIGSFTSKYHIYGVYIMLVFGVLGYILKHTGFPIPAVIIGLILGPIAEANLNRSLLLSQGKLTIFIQSPIAIVMIILTLLSIIFSLYSEFRSRSPIKSET